MLSLLLSYLLIYKYAVLFSIVAWASFGIPAPATALLMASGAFAAQGYLDLPSILLYGFFASVLGDVSGYVISLRYGREILIRIGFKSLLVSERFTAVENIFTRHSVSAIFLSRFLATGLGPAINILAGLAKIPYRKFLLFDILGEFLYITLYIGLGYVFGDQWETISKILGNATTVLVLIVLLLILFIILWRVKNRKR